MTRSTPITTTSYRSLVCMPVEPQAAASAFGATTATSKAMASVAQARAAALQASAATIHTSAWIIPATAPTTKAKAATQQVTARNIAALHTKNKSLVKT